MSIDTIDRLVSAYEQTVFERAVEIAERGSYMGGIITKVLPEFFSPKNQEEQARIEDALLRHAPHRLTRSRIAAMGNFSAKHGLTDGFEEEGALPEGTMVNLFPDDDRPEDERRVAGSISFPVTYGDRASWLTFAGRYVVEQPQTGTEARKLARVNKKGLPPKPLALPVAYLIDDNGRSITDSDMAVMQPMIGLGDNRGVRPPWREAPAHMSNGTIADAIIAATDSFVYVNLDFE